MRFPDHFSDTADRYARFRPGYPDELFEYLAGLAPARGRAWDCGTGSGQAAQGLAAHFDWVIATDASRQQVRRRRLSDGVVYTVCAAEAAPLAATSIDLIAVAQAVHWFDMRGFYAEVRRVARSGGIIAVWSYNLCTIASAIDAVVRRYHGEVVGPYWPPERSVVETAYRTIAFPFAELAAPDFEMTADWSLADFAGYLGTWSSSRGYRRATGADPLDVIREELADAWGDPDHSRRVVWPLHLRVGRV
jgi:SAM-dependent methyltransferase